MSFSCSPSASSATTACSSLALPAENVAVGSATFSCSRLSKCWRTNTSSFCTRADTDTVIHPSTDKSASPGLEVLSFWEALREPPKSTRAIGGTGVVSLSKRKGLVTML
jgi:hypothetical protein